MIIKQKNLSLTTKLLRTFALIIGLGIGILLFLYLTLFTLKALSAETGGNEDLLLIPIGIGPLLLVIFAIFRERVGGFLLIIVSLAFIIWFQIAMAGKGAWIGFLLGGPFLISGVLFLLSYYSHKSRN